MTTDLLPEPFADVVPPEAMSTALAAPQDRIQWRTASALQARVVREGWIFVVTLEQVTGDWLAIALATPEEAADLSIGERATRLLDQHAHQILCDRGTLMEAMSLAELWLATASPPEELCDCEDLGGEQTADSKQQTASEEKQTADSGQQTASEGESPS